MCSTRDAGVGLGRVDARASSRASSAASMAFTGARARVATSTAPRRSVVIMRRGRVAARPLRRRAWCAGRAGGAAPACRWRVRGSVSIACSQRGRWIRRQPVGMLAQRVASSAGAPGCATIEQRHRLDAVGVGHGDGRGLRQAGAGERDALLELDQVDPAAVHLDQRILAPGEAPAARRAAARTGPTGEKPPSMKCSACASGRCQ